MCYINLYGLLLVQNINTLNSFDVRLYRKIVTIFRNFICIIVNWCLMLDLCCQNVALSIENKTILWFYEKSFLLCFTKKMGHSNWDSYLKINQINVDLCMSI